VAEYSSAMDNRDKPREPSSRFCSGILIMGDKADQLDEDGSNIVVYDVSG